MYYICLCKHFYLYVHVHVFENQFLKINYFWLQILPAIWRQKIINNDIPSRTSLLYVVGAKGYLHQYFSFVGGGKDLEKTPDMSQINDKLY